MTKPHRATLDPWWIAKRQFHDFPCVHGIVTETDGHWFIGDCLHTSPIVTINYDHTVGSGVLETKNSIYKLGNLVYSDPR